MAYKCHNFCNGDVLDAEVMNCIEECIASLDQKMEDLLYKTITISSFTAKDAATGKSTLEIGTEVTDVAFSWKFNKTPKSVTFNGEEMAVDSTGATLSGLSVKSTTSWPLVATDERDASASKPAWLTFLNGVYYGVLPVDATVNASAISSLSHKELRGDFNKTYPAITANAGQRHAFAFPTIYGTPSFVDADSKLGADFYKANEKPIQFENASGYTEDYDIWLATNAELGSLKVTIAAKEV